MQRFEVRDDRGGITQSISIPSPYQCLNVKSLLLCLLYNLVSKALSVNSLAFQLSTYHVAWTLGVKD